MNNNIPILDDFDTVLSEEGGAFIIAELTDGDERASGESIQNMTF